MLSTNKEGIPFLFLLDTIKINHQEVKKGAGQHQEMKHLVKTELSFQIGPFQPVDQPPNGVGPVSYTHLDVYKRQLVWLSGLFENFGETNDAERVRVLKVVRVVHTPALVQFPLQAKSFDEKGAFLKRRPFSALFSKRRVFKSVLLCYDTKNRSVSENRRRMRKTECEER